MRLKISLLLVALSAACGGAKRPHSEAPPNQALMDCMAARRAAVDSPPPEVLAKLDPWLQTRLKAWRSEVDYAHCANQRANERSQIEARLVAVAVKHQGGLSTLAEAGLSTGFDQDGTVSGVIELRRVLTFAALHEVIFVSAEPDVHPN